MTSFKVEAIVFTPDPVLFKNFKSAPTGVVGEDLRRRGRQLVILGARSAQKRSGSLARSIGMQYVVGDNPMIIVGSDKKYAYFEHEGTRAHLIQSKTGKTLRFKVKGKVVYARRVHSPGTRGSKFLSRHLLKVAND